VVEIIEGGEYDFIKLNFPNGDMVGHTGVYQAVLCSMEAMDLSIQRMKNAVEKAGGVLILSADHGNADDMFEHEKKTGSVVIKEDGKRKAKTSHSLNPVPCIIFDADYQEDYSKSLKEGLGISSLSATCLNLLGFEAPEDYDPSVLDAK